jgi:two-component system chemotaxis sensor kinase CheA
VSSREENDTAALFPEYVAECEEHLTSAGQTLLDLESAPGKFDREQLDGLFRNFHTVKGLSGMVGLQEAERLAHNLENYLGAIRKGIIPLSDEGVAVLVEGVRSLERVIAARAGGEAIPDVGPLVVRITALLPDQETGSPPTSPIVPDLGPNPSDPPPDPFARANAAVRNGNRVWRVRFEPSPVLTERGVTVNAVRERLREAGEIIHAQPIVTPGRVAFAFLVLSERVDFAASFQEGGLTVEQYRPSLRNEVEAAPFVPGQRANSMTPTNLVRVDLSRLDELMRTIGELVITRARLDNGLGRIATSLPAFEWRDLRETSLSLERQLRDLREGVMRVRLVPIRNVFGRMRFVVRDLTREMGKEVDLVLTGEETEVDKFVVERLADPLLHLIRNAVSHGLESPTERMASGKSRRGRIDLRAAAAGGAIAIEVEDDGWGIDIEQAFARARSAGLVAPDAVADPVGLLELICSPGFSTRESTDRASGRGVGMDVVARAVEDLGGTLALSTQVGRGTRFTVRLPLTLVIADALIVTVAGQTYAVPQTAVREVVEIALGATTTLENNELISHRGGVLPLLRLTDVFGTKRPTGAYTALIIGEGMATFALATDRVIGLREVVIRPLADPLVQVPGIAGATELGDGRAVLILDAVGLARYSRSRRRPNA